MSKSLARVTAALAAQGLDIPPFEMGDCRTAQAAAEAAGCTPDQIVKSILFAGQISGRLYLFLTAGGNQVDLAKASALTGEPLGRAEARQVRDVTGFAIGGVSPVGHLTQSPVFMDPRLMDFAQVWAAAGTPRHIFPIAPPDLARITGALLTEFTA